MIQYAKAISSNSDTESAQAFVFPKVIPEDAQGQAILACLISGGGEDVFTRIRQSGPFIEENFFSSELPISSRLTNLQAELKKSLSGIKNPQFILTVLKDDVLYLVPDGLHKAYLLRENKLISLIDKHSTGQLISGYIKPNDRLLLISTHQDSETGEVLPLPKDLPERFLNSPLDVFEEEVTSFQHELPERFPMAAILVQNLDQKIGSVQEEKVIPNLDQTFKAVPAFKIPNVLPLAGKVFGKLIPRSKKMISIIVIVLLLLVAGGVGYWYLTKDKRAQSVEHQKILTQARQKLTEAQNLKDSDPQKAQTALVEAKNFVNSVLADDSKNKEAQEVKSSIDQGGDEILKIYRISDWPVFLSLNLIKSDFSSSKMAYSLNKVLFLDETQKTLVSVDLREKTNQILAGNTQLGDAKVASLNGDQAYVYSSDKGILKIDTTNQKVTVVAKPDEDWGSISDIVGFASNVYALDTGKNQIWKYVPTSASYSDKSAYIKDGNAVGLGDAKRMQIDFSVWILKPGPEIIKLTGGNSDFFGITGMDTNLQEVSSLFVSEDTDDVYFLEPEGSRLVVLKKSGEYKHQYVGEKFATAADLVVDEEEKKIYLLENNTIFQIDLR